MAKREFHLGDVLSVTTGCVVSLRGMYGVCDVLSFLCGENLYVHQLPRARQACAPVLLGRYPQLAEVSAEGLTEATWGMWLAEQTARHGEFLELEPMPPGVYEAKDPLQEMLDVVGKDARIIVVPVPPPFNPELN